MMKTILLAAAVCAGAFSVVIPVAVPAARAETAAEFLKSLEGNYSGRGNAVVIGEETTKISCKLANSFDASAKALKVNGNCASTKGKGVVNGKVVVSGNQLSGSFVSTRQNVRVTKTSGQLSGKTMVLSSNMMNDKTGQLIRVQQHVSRTGNGIKAVFYAFDSKTQKYKPAGSINLKRQ
ncbi:MAG: hypothetical protein M9908_00375 [Phyllobacteriaceae bacterium]|nr:hypothetical protein [Phyllobacteriaceae bacterium]